jgi:hypothetical protein
MKRVTKDAADYGRGMKSAHCAICKHFEAPDRCEIVIGKISPKGWCHFFFAKKAQDDG